MESAASRLILLKNRGHHVISVCCRAYLGFEITQVTAPDGEEGRGDYLSYNEGWEQLSIIISDTLICSFLTLYTNQL